MPFLLFVILGFMYKKISACFIHKSEKEGRKKLGPSSQKCFLLNWKEILPEFSLEWHLRKRG